MSQLPAAAPAGSRWRRLTRRIQLRHLIFAVLFVSGILPLATSTGVLVWQNREALQTQELAYLTRSAESLSRELNDYLVGTRRQLSQLGAALLTAPGPELFEERMRESWAQQLLTDFLVSNSDRVVALRVLDLEGAGPVLGPGRLAEESRLALDRAFARSLELDSPAHDFVVRADSNEPLAVLSVPIGAEGPPSLVIQALLRFDLMERVFEREARGEVGVFLIDRAGKVLWSEGAQEDEALAVSGAPLVVDFVAKPLNLTAEYSLTLDGAARRMLGQVSPVEAAGWGVVVHKPVAIAFDAVRRMVAGAALSTLILALFALIAAAIFAKGLAAPIQQLAASSTAIAAGRYGQRVEVASVGREVDDLARTFNQMSGQIASSVDQLQRAASANRELFVSSIRAFAAAIDAKDPYTRGHSERVARYSRTIARHLGVSEELQDRIWIGAVLHDVGKIGIEDRVLKKGGVLTAAEYDQMKLHTVIGAEILGPIEQLREMLPIVRWHHEAWNGRGYPDGLRGEEIPLLARIVGVADTFDAITTTRPYQTAHTPEYGVQTVTKLTGTRFDAKVVTAFLKAWEAGDIVVDQATAAAATQAEAAS